MVKISLAVTFTLLTLSSFAFAVDEKIELTKGNPFQKNLTGGGPTAFVIENAVGEVNVYEAKGEAVEVSARYVGEDKATLVVEQPSLGQMRLRIEYPQGSGGGDKYVMGSNFSSINMSGGNMIISGSGSITINGKTFTSSSGGTVSFGGTGQVILKVGIPASHLSHLKVDTDTADIEVEGRFENELMKARNVLLSSDTGDIACSGLCSLGAILVKTDTGDISLTGISGDIRAKSDTGNVSATGNRGQISASSDTGNISVSGQTGGNVQAKTEMGNIRLDNPEANVKELAKTEMGQVRGKKAGVGEKVACATVLKELFDF